MPSDTELTALLAQRKALTDRLEAIRLDIGRGLDADSEERANELENADVLDEIARVTSEQLVAVDARIARVRAAGNAG